HGLVSIAERLVPVYVYLDNEPVCAGGQGCKAHGRDKGEPTRRVGRVDDDGEMAQFLDGRNRTEIERIPRVLLEGPYTPFTEDDVGVTLAQDVLGAVEPFLDRRIHSPLQ